MYTTDAATIRTQPELDHIPPPATAQTQLSRASDLQCFQMLRQGVSQRANALWTQQSYILKPPSMSIRKTPLKAVFSWGFVRIQPKRDLFFCQPTAPWEPMHFCQQCHRGQALSEYQMFHFCVKYTKVLCQTDLCGALTTKNMQLLSLNVLSTPSKPKEEAWRVRKAWKKRPPPTLLPFSNLSCGYVPALSSPC